MRLSANKRYGGANYSRIRLRHQLFHARGATVYASYRPCETFTIQTEVLIYMSKFRCYSCGKMSFLEEVRNCPGCGTLMCPQCATNLESSCPRCSGFIEG